MNSNTLIETFYSKDGRKQSPIYQTDTTFYIEFYHDDILISAVELKEHNIHYAQSIAENFCNGVLKLDPWRANESIKSHLHKSCNQ